MTRENDTLLVAAMEGDIALLKEALAEGADPCTLDRVATQSVLQYAVFAQSLSCVQALLKAGANVQYKNRANGSTALHDAAHLSNYDILAELLVRGAQLNEIDQQGLTPLLRLAANAGSVDGKWDECFELLLRNGANVFACTTDGETVLHIAAFGGVVGLVEKLVRLGLDCNAITNRQETVLSYAIEQDHEESIRHLIAAGADIEHEPALDGRSILEVAKERGWKSIVSDIEFDALRGEKI